MKVSKIHDIINEFLFISGSCLDSSGIIIGYFVLIYKFYFTCSSLGHIPKM